jgi:hypothetical protein
MSYHLVVDLGTTYTAAAVARDADPNSAAVQALNDASMSCMLSAVG